VGTKTFDFNTNAILIDAAAVAGSGNITVFETNSYTCSGDVHLPVQVYAQPARKILSVMQSYVPTVPMSIVLPTVLVSIQLDRTGWGSNYRRPVGKFDNDSICQCRGTISVRETNAAGCITTISKGSYGQSSSYCYNKWRRNDLRWSFKESYSNLTGTGPYASLMHSTECHSYLLQLQPIRTYLMLLQPGHTQL